MVVFCSSVYFTLGVNTRQAPHALHLYCGLPHLLCPLRIIASLPHDRHEYLVVSSIMWQIFIYHHVLCNHYLYSKDRQMLKELVMRKVIVLEFVTLDGVIQAGGGPEEDTSGGFAYGGWQAPYSDDVIGTVMNRQ